MNRFFERLISVMIACVAIVPLRAAAGNENAPSAAEMVQRIIDEENKVHSVRSLYLRFKGKWTKTPEGIAKSRAELEKRRPGRKIDVDREPSLWPEINEDVVLAWDHRRIYKSLHQHKSQLDLRIWDGNRAFNHIKYFTHEQEQYFLNSRPEVFADSFFIDLSP